MTESYRYPTLLCDFIDAPEVLRAVNFTLAMMRDGEAEDKAVAVASRFYVASTGAVAFYVRQHLLRRMDVLRAQVEAGR